MRYRFKLFFLTIIVSMAIGACSQTASASESAQINAGGATFPLPIYTEWTLMYQKVDPSVAINYQGIGSGGGKAGIINRVLDFAGSDSLLLPEEYQAGGDLQMYPMVAGAVVAVYNVNGLQAPMVLNGQTLASIFSGKIAKWNDPALKALNPAAALPDAAITVIHRSDGSGTTEIFTKGLSAFSPEWKQTVGAGTAVQWPVDAAGNGVGGKGNQGIAAAVQNTPNSIGYVELSFALANKIATASMVNKAGQTVKADGISIQSAIDDYSGAFSDKFTADIVDGPGSKSWPLTGYTYIILHTTSMTDCAKAANILKFLRWALTDDAAARRAADLGYAGLPAAVRDRVLVKLADVTCQGQKVLK